ncbi:MAG TPA: SDR family oxidoreductase [Chitinophagales bacterium]|jgi:short-subunit dehydrogenase|nr:SDR family oxidoreductase [Chitinophagales bacterium]MBP6154059.1 SDR family oxidoreductase [Chitinophagales bacterium]HQV78539.1 SDR family oxidoreductase [Chitinophagales bacterium]HQW78775.1 SDR family oxidoreductase [Chitinophagales bacterium]HRB18581.1 SDR family oxidoreductase [Chitinophagales bacterium]
MNIVITGASRGIGKAIAEKFAQQHHQVLICSRDELKLNAIIHQFPSIKTFVCDVADKQSLYAFAEYALTIFPTIDVLINNAGVFIPGKIIDEEETALEKMLHTNLFSAYYITKKLAPRMMEQKNGFIFNMCSVASLKAYENGGSYSISKFALLGFSKTLREELKSYNIKVTSILPGATLTDSWAGVDLPETRFSKAEDIADLVYAITQLSALSVVEELVIRPQLGDI